MVQQEPPRTRLEQLLRQRHLTLDKFRELYRDASGSEIGHRQAYRWMAGDLKGTPHPHSLTALERMFQEPAEKLFGPPYGGLPARSSAADLATSTPERGQARTDWKGQLISMSADRARDFLAKAEATNVGPETIDQLADDVRRLAVASQHQPFPLLLSELVDTQDRAFSLLEGRQKPEQTRDLYLLTGIVSGFLAKASHDLGAPHDALTQTRAAYACADNAGHDGLRAWIRGLQALITYWAGRYGDSVRYARLGVEAAERSRGSASVWLACGEARSLGAQGNFEAAHAALSRAAAARERVEPDELDELGSICTFSRSTQLYYSADALAWGGEAEANEAEQLAVDALEALAAAPPAERGGFGNEQGARCDLAVARLHRGELDGAAEALAPVLELPADRRQQGIVRSVERVRDTVRRLSHSETPRLQELDDNIESFMARRLALPPGES